MKSLSASGYLFSFVLLILTFPGLMAQNNNADNFVPEVGQQGKDVVWVPTPQELVDTMLAIAKVTPSDFLIDLGSGDGRTVITAAKKGARALGIEYNPKMVELSKRNAAQEGVGSKAEFLQGDLFEADLSKATVITMFLLPEINLKLRPRLLDLKPGTRIVSNTFTMGDWYPDLEVTTPENWNSWTTALLWIVPAKVNGQWKIGNNELDINQEFQMIRGTLTIAGKTLAITDGRLDGKNITFNAGEAHYKGVVEGTKMTGTVTTGSTNRSWSAVKM